MKGLYFKGTKINKIKKIFETIICLTFHLDCCVGEDWMFRKIFSYLGHLQITNQQVSGYNENHALHWNISSLSLNTQSLSVNCTQKKSFDEAASDIKHLENVEIYRVLLGKISWGKIFLLSIHFQHVTLCTDLKNFIYLSMKNWIKI